MAQTADSGEKGYTLVEVLVAFLVLALTLTALLRGFAAGARNIDVASEYTAAVMLAEARLAAEAGRTVMPAALAPAASVPAPGYVVSSNIVEIGVAGAEESGPVGLSMQRVAVAVQWAGRSEARRFELATIRLVPSAPDGGGAGRW